MQLAVLDLAWNNANSLNFKLFPPFFSTSFYSAFQLKGTCLTTVYITSHLFSSPKQFSYIFSSMAKKLGEFLQEKQEPFALNVYLVERGYLKNRLYCSKKSTCNTLNKSSGCALHHKKTKSIPNCSKIVRTCITKIISFGNQNKLKKSVGWKHNVSESYKFSSASNTSMFNSSEAKEAATYTSIKAEDITLKKDCNRYFRDGNQFSMSEIDPDRQFGTRIVKDSNQLSPASVLEETEFNDYDDDDGASKNDEKRTEESSSKCAVSGKGIEEEAIIGCKFIEDYTKNKNAVLQTEKLLFDCAQELQCQTFLVAEELWKLIYQNIWLWSKEMIVDETNVEQLVHSHVVTNSLKKWSHFEEQTREIASHIEAIILEDIGNEIISDLIINLV
ncbi:hypothetical protein LIER_12341 [Lithospermum erythrorhizon]|uniref:DUF4378 domain-containing protein n=1 Tax=Lithospermum erythrorhizon TaxID=34254 RepID=A0AAV3PVG4_LITER